MSGVKQQLLMFIQIQIFSVTPTEHMLVFKVAFEYDFPLHSFPGHLRPSHIILHREANPRRLYVFATKTATPDSIRKYYPRGNRGEEDSTAVRFVIINLVTHTSSEPYVLQVGQDAHTLLSTLQLHPSLPLLADFPLSLVPLASATPLASSPPASPPAAASAATSSSEQPSSPLLEAIRELRDVPFSSSPTAASPRSAPSTSASKDDEELEFIDAEEMPGFSDTARTSCEPISTVDDEAEHQL